MWTSEVGKYVPYALSFWHMRECMEPWMHLTDSYLSWETARKILENEDEYKSNHTF